MNEQALDGSADDDSVLTRESGIVDVLDGGPVERSPVERRLVDQSLVAQSVVDQSLIDRQRMDRKRVEREASPVASAVESGSQRGEDIDITTDDDPEHGDTTKVVTVANGSVANGTVTNGTVTNGNVANGSVANGSVDDVTIEVSDEEIETAEPPAYRATMPSLSSYAPPASSWPSSSPPGGLRSRPPAPPSSRAHPPGRSSLPPPRWSRPSSGDPWALANKTLELRHANARIVELEELVAFRDARLVELEENLARARRKIEVLERQIFSEHRLPEPSFSETGAQPPVLVPTSQASPLPALESRASTARPEESPLITEIRPALVLPVFGADNRKGALESSPGVDVVRKNIVPKDIVPKDDGDDDDGFADDADRDSEYGAADGTSSARDGSEDDLQQISGIGPRFEAALRKQGITRLSQIAAWSEADVRQVAKALKIPKSRIVKGRWVEVAREVIGTRAASE